MKNELTVFEENGKLFTDSREVADMIDKSHKNLLADIRTYVKYLAGSNFSPLNYFIESTYVDAQGKERPCYQCTKKGCDMIANKLQGKKGVIFTAKYIEAFDKMADFIQKGIAYQQPEPKKNLPSTNMLVKTVTKIFEKAGVSPLYIAAEAKRLYKEQAGIDIQIPLLTDDTMSKLYDCTEIAKELGIISNKGKPHSLAVSAIIQKLDVSDGDIVKTAYSRHGHDGVAIQYKPPIFEMVKAWLVDNGYPIKVPYIDSKGNHKMFSVAYTEVA